MFKARLGCFGAVVILIIGVIAMLFLWQGIIDCSRLPMLWYCPAVKLFQGQ